MFKVKSNFVLQIFLYSDEQFMEFNISDFMHLFRRLWLGLDTFLRLFVYFYAKRFKEIELKLTKVNQSETSSFKNLIWLKMKQFYIKIPKMKQLLLKVKHTNNFTLQKKTVSRIWPSISSSQIFSTNSYLLFFQFLA